MDSLEASLDKEVIEFITEVEQLDKYKALHEGTISDETYIRILKTFYVMELISADAVNKASQNTKQNNPYLSKRFDLCAQGERGHAEIALKDLQDMGIKKVDTNGADIAKALYSSNCSTSVINSMTSLSRDASKLSICFLIIFVIFKH